MQKQVLLLVLTLFGLVVLNSSHAAKWDPVTGEELSVLYSDTTLKGAQWKAYYCANGTGTLITPDNSQAQSWKQHGEDIICISEANGSKECFTFMQSQKNPNKYRVTRQEDGKIYGFTLKKKKPDFCS